MGELSELMAGRYTSLQHGIRDGLTRHAWAPARTSPRRTVRRGCGKYAQNVSHADHTGLTLVQRRPALVQGRRHASSRILHANLLAPAGERHVRQIRAGAILDLAIPILEREPCF